MFVAACSTLWKNERTTNKKKQSANKLVIGDSSAIDDIPQNASLDSTSTEPAVNIGDTKSVIEAFSESTWSECVGVIGEDCKQFISTTSPELEVYIVQYRSFVTMDYDLGRVRIFVDEKGVVMKEPRKG